MNSVRNFLDLSTGHLSQSTRDWMDARAQETVLTPCNVTHWVAGTPYGWFVYADEEPCEEYGFPADLIACMREARKRGCDYILFDRDADQIDGELPWLEDEEIAP